MVHGGAFDVIGASYVAITDAGPWTDPGSRSPNDAARKGKIYFLAPGQRFDLTTRRVVRVRAATGD